MRPGFHRRICVMLVEILIRFVVGGLTVSTFAILGDILRPKRFAGLFGAAPSIALATIALTLRTEGAAYVAVEARSMIAGALAFLLYAWLASKALLGARWSAFTVTSSLLVIWGGCAFALWRTFIR